MSLTDDQLSRVCRVAIAAVMGRDVATMRVSQAGAGIVRIYYDRDGPSDRWTYECKAEGGKLVWRGAGSPSEPGHIGRWRDEEPVAFSIEGSRVTATDPVTGNQESHQF